MPDRPPRVRLQLGAELQTARTLAGMNQRDLAARIGVSQSMVARVERGERTLARPDTTTWLRATGPAPAVVERIMVLTEAAHTETRTWRDLLASTDHLQEQARRRNADAALVQNFQPTLLPGLLQTADYARHVIPLSDLDGSIDHAAHLAARIERQGVLREPDRRFDFLIAERLLRWEPAPGVLAPQLAQLASAMQLNAVTLAVLPDAHVGVLPWHNFVLRHPADGSPTYVAVEMIHGEQILVEPEDVRSYELQWKRMWDAAITGDAALDLLR